MKKILFSTLLICSSAYSESLPPQKQIEGCVALLEGKGYTIIAPSSQKLAAAHMQAQPHRVLSKEQLQAILKEFLAASPAEATRVVDIKGLESHGFESGKYKVTLSLASEGSRTVVQNVGVHGSHLKNTVYKNFSNNQALEGLVEGIYEAKQKIAMVAELSHGDKVAYDFPVWDQKVLGKSQPFTLPTFRITLIKE